MPLKGLSADGHAPLNKHGGVCEQESGEMLQGEEGGKGIHGQENRVKFTWMSFEKAIAYEQHCIDRHVASTQTSPELTLEKWQRRAGGGKLFLVP